MTGRMESEQTADLAAALAKAQGIMPHAIFDKQNPHYKSKYASYPAVVDAVRKPLTDNGICYIHSTELRDGLFVLRTILQLGAQWRASDYPLPSGVEPQKLASAMTYGKRYNLSNLTGVASDEDDDGEATRKGNGASVETGEVVSEEQAKTLVAALEAREMPVERLLRWARVTRIDDVPADLYAKALATIQKHGDEK